jgi:hypothetical protein
MRSLIEILEEAGRTTHPRLDGSFIIEPVSLEEAQATVFPAAAISDGWKYVANLFWYHNLHHISTYLGRFPPALAHYFIAKFSKPGDTVFDPFVGSGTVPLEANLLQRSSVGFDTFTYAYILSHAKARPIDQQTFLDYIDEQERLIRNTKPETSFDSDPLYSDLNVYFHPNTLKSLMLLRATLLEQLHNGSLTGEAYDKLVFMLAMLCGVLHGPSSMFLSVRTKDTWSGSVKYVERFIEKHHLTVAERSPYESLRMKASRIFREPLPVVKGVVRQQDSTTDYDLADESVDLVVTSPPYLSVRRYAKDNWLRVWLLGSTPQQERSLMLATSAVPLYEEKMRQALKQVWRVLRENGTCVLVAGDVTRGTKAKDIYLTGYRLAAIAEELGFGVVACITDEHAGMNRRTSQFYTPRNDEGAVVRGPCDRIVILSKGNSILRCNQPISYPLSLTGQW